MKEWTAQLKDAKEEKRDEAADALVEIGGKEAALGLLGAWRQARADEKCRLAAALDRVLWRADGTAPALIELLSSEDPSTRLQSARWLLRLGSRAKDSADALRNAARQAKDRTIHTCLRAVLLQTNRATAKAEVPDLLKSLREFPKGDGLEAALLLGFAGKEAVEPLRDLLKKGEAPMPMLATVILGLIGPDAVAAAGDLRLLCKGGDPMAGLVAAWALASVAPKDAKEGIALLRSFLKLLREKQPPQLEAVALAILLAPISVEDEAMATEILVDALGKSQDPGARPLAVWGLCAIGASAEDAALGLRRVLNDEDFFVRVCAAYALGTTNRKHREKAVAALRNAVRADEEQITSTGLPLMIDGEVLACRLLAIDGRHLLLLEGLLRNRQPFHRFPTPFLLAEALACLQAPQFRLADPDTKQALVRRWRRLPILALEELDPAAARGARAARRKMEKEQAEKLAHERAEQEKKAQKLLAMEQARRKEQARERREKKAQVDLNYAIKLQKTPETQAKAIERLRLVVKEFPDTQAASEAKKRLRQLKEK